MDERATPYLAHSSDWQKPLSRGLKGGGGGGTLDGMEARVARLEEDAKDIKSKLDKLIEVNSAVRTDVAEMKGRLSALPSFSVVTDLATSVSALKAKVDGLPSLAKLATLIGLFATFLALLPKIQALIGTALNP